MKGFQKIQKEIRKEKIMEHNLIRFPYSEEKTIEDYNDNLKKILEKEITLCREKRRAFLKKSAVFGGMLLLGMSTKKNTDDVIEYYKEHPYLAPPLTTELKEEIIITTEEYVKKVENASIIKESILFSPDLQDDLPGGRAHKTVIRNINRVGFRKQTYIVPRYAEEYVKKLKESDLYRIGIDNNKIQIIIITDKEYKQLCGVNETQVFVTEQFGKRVDLAWEDAHGDRNRCLKITKPNKLYNILYETLKIQGRASL